jgi:hypothetical protein
MAWVNYAVANAPEIFLFLAVAIRILKDTIPGFRPDQKRAQLLRRSPC